MVSSKSFTNKMVPTIHSCCKIVISKVVKTDSTVDSDCLLEEGELSLVLEDAHTKVDRDFVKFLLTTRLGETVVFRTDGLEVELNIVHIEYGPPMHELSDKEKLSRAKRMKDKGSELFKQNKYESAFHRFRAGVQYLIFMNDKTLEEADELYIMLCNNMAMCQMKFNNHAYAIDLCCKVLNVDERNVKALYRRAVCYTEQKRWAEAHADLILATNIDNTNPSVKRLIEVVQDKLRVQDEEYRNVVKNMFR